MFLALVKQAVCLLACTTISVPVRAQAAAASEVERVSAVGRLLYAYDQAAWHGTDDLRAKMPDFATRVGGYLVDGPVEAPTVYFFDRDAAAPRKLYAARFEGTRLGGSEVLATDADRSFTPLQLRMIAARAAASAAATKDEGVRPCKRQPFNTVVLPPTTPDGPIPVYFLTAQTSNDSLPFGGHFSTEVAATGAVAPFRRFTNSCIEMPKRPPRGQKGAALFITHILSETPTELHVFNSLYLDVPLLVGAGSGKGRMRIWPIDKGAVLAPQEMPTK